MKPSQQKYIRALLMSNVTAKRRSLREAKSAPATATTAASRTKAMRALNEAVDALHAFNSALAPHGALTDPRTGEA
jgi:hypothetical protein